MCTIFNLSKEYNTNFRDDHFNKKKMYSMNSIFDLPAMSTDVQ